MSNLIKLKDLIDMLIDIEQSAEGETVMGELPVLVVWPDAAVLRIKQAVATINVQRIPVFGIPSKERYVSLRTA
jgi:hypothetical protein